jgi:hypothetical protein
VRCGGAVCVHGHGLRRAVVMSCHVVVCRELLCSELNGSPEQCEAEAAGGVWTECPRPECDAIDRALWSTGIFNAISTMAFSYDVGPAHVPVLSELRQRTKTKGVVIMCSTVALSTLIYMIIAIFGYLHFTDRYASQTASPRPRPRPRGHAWGERAHI